MNLTNLGVKDIKPIDDDWYALKISNTDIYNKIHYVLFRNKAIVVFDLKLKYNIVKLTYKQFNELLLFSRKMKFYNLNNKIEEINTDRCKAITKKGHRCKFKRVENSEYCWYHKIITIRDSKNFV